MERLYEEEEIYWRQRGADKELFEGDANTTYFHMSATGRKRKKSIVSLEHNGETVTDQEKIRGIIYDYYKQLFGSGGREREPTYWKTRGVLMAE